MSDVYESPDRETLDVLRNDAEKRNAREGIEAARRALAVDDLTTSSCVVCGTDSELTRPDGLLIDGVWHGRIVCAEHQQVFRHRARRR